MFSWKIHFIKQMRKKLLLSILTIIGIFFITLFYLSYFGIKTNNLNSFIENKVKSYDSRLALKLNEVFLKLSLNEFSIKVNIKDSSIGIKENYIGIDKIDVNLNLIKFFRNKNSIEKVQIVTDENKITEITEFLNLYKFNLARSVIYSQINEGKIKAIANIIFDKKDESKTFYEIKGYVENAKLNLIGFGELNNINFKFNIKDKKYNIENTIFEYQNINFNSKKINIIKSDKFFEVNGDLNNEKGLINTKSLSNLSSLNLDILDEKKILIETNNKFKFKILSNRIIENFEFKSNLKFDELFTNKKYQNLIYLKSGEIETTYVNKNLSINLISGFSFIDSKNKKKVNKDQNVLKLNIAKKGNENFKIKGNLKNSEAHIDPKVLFEILKTNFDILSTEKVLISSNNEFEFQIDKNNKIKHLSINSILNYDKLNFNKNLQSPIYLEGGKIETFIKNKNYNVKIDSKYSFFKDEYKNKKNNQKIIFKVKNNKKNLVDIETIFQTNKLKINTREFSKYLNLNINLIKDQDIIITSKNKINLSINKKNIISNLKINSFLNFEKLSVNYKSNILKKFFKVYDDNIYLTGDSIEINYTKNSTEITGKGKYSFNEKYDDYEIKFFNKNNLYEFETFFNLNNIPIKIDQINYFKKENKLSNINLIGSYNKNNKNLYLKEANLSEENNKLQFSNLTLELINGIKIKNIDKLEFNYLNDKKKLNNINLIKYNNNFKLTGKDFDGRFLINNIIKGNKKSNFLKLFKNLNSEISLNLDQFYLGDKSYLKQVVGNLVIKNNKIYSGIIDANLNKKNKFSYKLKTTVDNKKITNLYIDEPEPFIKNYKFIKGFKKGKLEFESTKIKKVSKSKLKIYDFKVKEVPLLAKVLTLASLQGIADLLTGEGIRFDELEMEYVNRDENNTTINEMYAIGPAISILLEGYLVKDKLISLRGTLVPATTINKSIKKIPLIGNILVGKQIGEGVFGVSFKIKGPPKDLKTTVNPVKTLTPRFITRTLEKLKGS